MRVGKHIRAVLAILDEHGPMTYRQVWGHYQRVELTNVRKYLSRAVAMGLATSSKDVKPMVFTSAKNWHEIAATKKPPAKPKTSAAAPSFGAHNPFGLLLCFFDEQGEADRKQLEENDMIEARSIACNQDAEFETHEAIGRAKGDRS